MLTYLLPIFTASIRSVGTACTMASVGVYLHRRGFIIDNGKRTLALISQQVTIPAFLFTKIVYCNQDWSDLPCPDITNDLQDVWILLFWPAFVVFCGIGVGYVAARLSNTPKEQYRSVLAACAFGNSTGLPITLLSVIHANFSPKQELGAIDPTLFLSVYLLLYPVLQWSIGGWLLAPIEDEQKTPKINGSKNIPQNIELSEEKASSSFTTSIRTVLNNKSAQTFYATLRRGMSETDASLYISNADLSEMALSQLTEKEVFAITLPPVLSDANMSVGLSIGEETPLLLNAHGKTFNTDNTNDNENGAKPGVPDANEDIVAEILNDDISSSSSRSGVTTKIVETSLLDTLKEILSRSQQPPVIGAVMGLFVASTPLRGIFVDLINRADAAPLEWVFDGLCKYMLKFITILTLFADCVGQAAVPVNMIILGCNLSASSLSSKPNEHKKNSNLLSNQTMLAIIIGKMLVMPIIGMISCFILSYFYPLKDSIDESFYLVCMIVFITPTANNVMVMVELSGSGTKEGIARVIGWQYAVAPLLLSLSVTATVAMALLLNGNGPTAN